VLSKEENDQGGYGKRAGGMTRKKTVVRRTSENADKRADRLIIVGAYPPYNLLAAFGGQEDKNRKGYYREPFKNCITPWMF